MPRKTFARPAAVALLTAVLVLGVATAAPARATVTVQVTWGAVACGGVGLFVYYAGTFGLEELAASAGRAAVEVGNRGVEWRLPVPRPEAPGPGGPESAPGSAPRLVLPLLEWRF